jgi:hypothetical protein
MHLNYQLQQLLPTLQLSEVRQMAERLVMAGQDLNGATLVAKLGWMMPSRKDYSKMQLRRLLKLASQRVTRTHLPYLLFTRILLEYTTSLSVHHAPVTHRACSALLHLNWALLFHPGGKVRFLAKVVLPVTIFSEPRRLCNGNGKGRGFKYTTKNGL